MKTLRLIPLCLLFACVDSDSGSGSQPRFALASFTPPEGSFDSFQARFRGTPDNNELVVRSPTDQAVHFEAVDVDGDVYTWTPSQPWQGGTYHVDLIGGMRPPTRTFDIVPFGNDPDFPGIEAGTAYRIDLEWGRILTPGLHFLLTQLRYSFVIEFHEMSDDLLDYRVVLLEEEKRCAGLGGRPKLNKLGGIHGSERTLIFPVPFTEVEAFDLEFDAGVVGHTLGEINVSALVQTASLAALFEDGTATTFCQEASALGVSCLPCPEEGPDACVAVEAEDLRGTFDPEWQIWDEMPACGEPTPQERVGLNCERITSCSTQGPMASWLVWPLLAFALRRRRS